MGNYIFLPDFSALERNKKTAVLSTAIFILAVVALYKGLKTESPQLVTVHQDWDILVLTQTWPKGLCFVQKGHTVNPTCRVPTSKNFWTISGLWPIKFATDGPQFCDESLVFNATSLFDIQAKLNEYWTDIDVSSVNFTKVNSLALTNRKKSIWSHEWKKYGTCAASLPSFDSEFKYYYRSIQMAAKYNMKYVFLEKHGIKLNSSLNVTVYWNAVKSTLKTNAWIECAINYDTKEQILVDVRICFDKSLNLVNCDGIITTEPNTDTLYSLTNCDINKPVKFLDFASAKYISTGFNSSVSEQYWGTITFSQTWPYTACHIGTLYLHEKECHMPSNHSQWIINGIWPSNVGTHGPFNCSSETPFNIKAMDTIIPELKDHWINSRGPKDFLEHEEQLWEREWNIHGQCASSSPLLNTEFKFFKQGLDWSKQYSVADILDKGGISLNNSYSLTQIWYALKGGLGKNPYINCYENKSFLKFYIYEVRLCFDKTLLLIDCDYFRLQNDRPYTNCPYSEDIYYIPYVN